MQQLSTALNGAGREDEFQSLLLWSRKPGPGPQGPWAAPGQWWHSEDMPAVMSLLSPSRTLLDRGASRAPASRQSSADGREEERVKVSLTVEWGYDAAALLPCDKYLQILMKWHMILTAGSGWCPLSHQRAWEGDGGQRGRINLLNRSLENPASSGRWGVLGWRCADRNPGVGVLPCSHPHPSVLHRLHGRTLLNCTLEGPSLPGLSQCLQGHGELVRRTLK